MESKTNAMNSFYMLFVCHLQNIIECYMNADAKGLQRDERKWVGERGSAKGCSVTGYQEAEMAMCESEVEGRVKREPEGIVEVEEKGAAY
jgi:hypothetical protein